MERIGEDHGLERSVVTSLGVPASAAVVAGDDVARERSGAGDCPAVAFARGEPRLGGAAAFAVQRPGAVRARTTGADGWTAVCSAGTHSRAPLPIDGERAVISAPSRGGPVVMAAAALSGPREHRRQERWRDRGVYCSASIPRSTLSHALLSRPTTHFPSTRISSRCLQRSISFSIRGAGMLATVDFTKVSKASSLGR